MAALPLQARLLCLVVVALSDPSPGRIPKVYNALITSNQNLEPSKAYPVYQPVLHDTFGYPFQPAVFYGDYPVQNGLPAAAAPPQGPSIPQQSSAPPQPPTVDQAPAKISPPPDPPASSEAAPPAEDKPTPAPPLPPNTQSPIPLNEFGLPPHVLPLGRFGPAYNGFTQVGPFTYTYPNFRFYDPYDPFSFSPYAGLPALYRPSGLVFPSGNVLEQGVPIAAADKTPPTRPEPSEQSPQSPPQEPSDLNVLNYASKDPAIPNVPPPPLPDGGLKSDTSE